MKRKASKTLPSTAGAMWLSSRRESRGSDPVVESGSTGVTYWLGLRLLHQRTASLPKSTSVFSNSRGTYDSAPLRGSLNRAGQLLEPFF